MTVVATEPVTSAVIATLATGTGHPVGDHAPPRPSVANSDPTRGRYSIVWSIPGGSVDGTWANPHEEATLVYQVDSVGRSRQQCQWLADRNRQVMLDRTASGWLHPITGSSFTVIYRNHQVVGAPENEGRDETGQETFTCRDRYEVTIGPV